MGMVKVSPGIIDLQCIK